MLMRPRLALAAPRRARVEIIPLIDVVFFLLATFVLFTFMLTRSQSLLVPLPSGGEKSVQENIILQVSADGSAYWNQELISLADLPARLAAYKQSAANPRVLLSGDDKAKWGPLVTALDEVRKAGIANFSIETRPRPTGK
jgi:biopolymer transport protein ExbD